MKKSIYIPFFLGLCFIVILSGCGGSSSGDIPSSPGWVQATSNATFSKRDAHTSVVFDNKQKYDTTFHG